MTPSTSRSLSPGGARSGNPAGSRPTVLKPDWDSGVNVSATIDATTTPRATGRPGKSLSPAISSTMAVIPTARTTGLVSPSWPPRIHTRSTK